MKRAVVISLVIHVGVVGVAGFWEGWHKGLGLPPVRVYTVDLVGSAEHGHARANAPSKSVPKPHKPSGKRSSAKAKRAPSTDAQAPRGSKHEVKGQPDKAPASKPSPSEAASDGAKRGGAARLDTPFPFPEYLQDVLALIDEAWQRPNTGHRSPRLKASVYFRIQQDGGVTDLKLEDPSGVVVFDQSALDAVAQCAPLPPLPEAFNGPYLGVHFDFED